MMHIDDTTYSVNDFNRYKTRNVKNQIVLATSLRKDNHHVTRLQHKEFGKTKKWNTYTISREGVVYQHYHPQFHSDFLGIKEVDKQIISIVLENMGSLFQTPSGKYINWLNEICDDKYVVEKKHLGYDYWEKFSDIQIKSTVDLCMKLCEEFIIPKKSIDFHYYHKDTIKFRGIVFRSNYIEDSNDINPLFDIIKFNVMLNNVNDSTE